MTVRLFDQLDAEPEPAQLPHCGGTSNMGDVPRCWQCRQRSRTPAGMSTPKPETTNANTSHERD
jgi:hypothetical protein